jgi:hypothetical protein
MMFDMSSVVEIVYKELQKKTCRPLYLQQYIPPAQIKCTLHTQPGVSHAQTVKQHYYAPTNIEEEPYTNQPYRLTADIKDLRNRIKSLFEQIRTTLPHFLTTVLTKLK